MPVFTFNRAAAAKAARSNSTDDFEIKDIMIGEEASKYRSVLDVKYPMEEGIVRDWDDMQVKITLRFHLICTLIRYTGPKSTEP